MSVSNEQSKNSEKTTSLRSKTKRSKLNSSFLRKRFDIDAFNNFYDSLNKRFDPEIFGYGEKRFDYNGINKRMHWDPLYFQPHTNGFSNFVLN